MRKSGSQKISFGLAVGLHIVLILLLIISFEHTIYLPAMNQPDENKEVIDAVVVNKKSLQDEIDRLAQIEAKRKQQEQAKKQELIRKEEEAKEKREKEEKLLVELKKKNEQLKKEAELQRVAQEKQEQELKEKVKAEQIKLKKIQKQKEEAELAAKNKAIVEQKAQELAKQQEAARKKEQALADEQAKRAANNNKAEIDKYALALRNRLHQHWRQPLGLNFNNLSCKIEVKLMPTGEVIDAAIVQPSGSVEFDRSALVAVQKASPLPMPTDPALASDFRQFTFTFRPEGA
ncbi:MAG TPA: cell envelope integrity protein TolA [Candidatus Berkiella sp.]|nr:cell envelope integrity protein TolA [Candidatus Berkiella sp.]